MAFASGLAKIAGQAGRAAEAHLAHLARGTGLLGVWFQQPDLVLRAARSALRVMPRKGRRVGGRAEQQPLGEADRGWSTARRGASQAHRRGSSCRTSAAMTGRAARSRCRPASCGAIGPIESACVTRCCSISSSMRRMSTLRHQHRRSRRRRPPGSARRADRRCAAATGTRSPGCRPRSGSGASSAAEWPRYSAWKRGMIFGTPVVPPESWKLSTSSLPSGTCARRSRASSSGMLSISASHVRCPGRRAAHNDQVLQWRMLFDHARREVDEVEAAEIGLHEVAARARLPRQLADLDFAVLRQRAHRHDPGLVAGQQHNSGLDGGAELEDGAIAGGKPELQERRAQALGACRRAREN